MKTQNDIITFRFIRFVAVGVCNTVINFFVLNFTFHFFHTGKLISGFIATTCAMLFSFGLNRRFVFVDNEKPVKKLGLFIAVTALGTLLVQNSVYILGLLLLTNHTAFISNLIGLLFGVLPSEERIVINLSNLFASLCVMLWNYNSYRILVFNDRHPGNEIIQTVKAETT